MAERSVEEIVGDLDRLEKERERLDSTYFKKSEDLTTRWEKAMDELKNS